MASPDFFDRLTATYQSAIASIQQNAQLSAENAQLKSEKEDLERNLDAITASFNEDEQEKAATATKLAGLEQLVNQYESIATPVAAA